MPRKAIFLSEAELAIIDEAAQAAGESRSAYLVRCGLALAGAGSTMTTELKRKVRAAVARALEGV